MYCTLIKPVGEKLKKKIIVIPCEILSSIPFEGLISHDKKDTVINYSGLEYLIYKYSISYTFTAELIKKEHFINDNSLLAFAPGYEGDINYRGIEANVEEINTIPDDYRIMKFTGKEATKGNFFLFYNKHSIIHLAMHSEANQSNDMLSRLIFYAGSANDGSMYAYELLDMDFKNKIVVLSGCNTGSGKIIKGEGVFSLARAFIMAGSSTVLFTQWELRDITGMNIMRNFYSCLYDGYSLDSALWRAKLKFLENAEPMKAHPAFWANYFHVGNDRALKITNYNSAIIGFGILMVACLLLILYFKFFK
ncbi:MAG: CHAT domain-containing protein [Bacteroidia bacterium]|nr:CHAT domain-containing protein [Bacteroidia bacterium]